MNDQKSFIPVWRKQLIYRKNCKCTFIARFFSLLLRIPSNEPYLIAFRRKFTQNRDSRSNNIYTNVSVSDVTSYLLFLVSF